MSYLVSQRTREVGIRMALGATRGRVLGEIVGRGMRLAGAGIVLGLAASLAAGRVLASFLYGVKPTDWVSLAAAAAALAVAALAACWLPGLRAAHVDQAVALRRP